MEIQSTDFIPYFPYFIGNDGEFVCQLYTEGRFKPTFAAIPKH